MVSPTSVKGRFALQPVLIEGHRKTLEWLSAIILWKREFILLQKLFDEYASTCSRIKDKQLIGHFQNVMLYYNEELLDSLDLKLRLHERCLASTLARNEEAKTAFYTEHDQLMHQADMVYCQIANYKEEFLAFAARIIK